MALVVDSYSGMDSAAFGLSSFFSVGEVVDITVGVDGGRSIPLVEVESMRPR